MKREKRARCATKAVWLRAWVDTGQVEWDAHATRKLAQESCEREFDGPNPRCRMPALPLPINLAASGISTAASVRNDRAKSSSAASPVETGS